MADSRDMTLGCTGLTQDAIDAVAAQALSQPALDSLLDPAPAVAAVLAAPTLVDLQGFAIGEHRFLVNYLDAVEIEEVGQLTRVPAAPAWMAGLVNLHGTVLAVLDLHSLLGGTRTVPVAGALPMLLVLRHRRDRVAILIDGMTRRMRFDQSRAQNGSTSAPFYGPHVVRAYPEAGDERVGAPENVGETLWHELDFVSLIDGLSAVAV